MGRHLVTGGAGFIGSYIARALLERGHEVVVLDNLDTGHPDNVPQGITFVNTDISRPEGLQSIPDLAFDSVLHLAAQSSGEISHAEPGRDLNTNALGTLLLLEWCQSHDVSRFLYASSMAVYGLTEHVPVREDQTLDPYSFYGIAKQAAEQYVRHYAKHGMKTTVFRMFNVYGPGQNLTNLRQGMVSIYLAYLAAGEPVLVKGSLERFRDFTYIDDVVEAWVKALDSPATHGKTYNLASGRKTLVRELIAELVQAWGHDPQTYPILGAEGTPGDQFGIYADITSLSRAIEWQPRVPLPDGLRRMATWAKGGHSQAA